MALLLVFYCLYPQQLILLKIHVPVLNVAQCLTCGLTTSHINLSSESAPVKFVSDAEELVYLRAQVKELEPLREQVQELHVLKDQVQELQLLKDQVQDVARVCNAVARGDLSQKITVVVQGVVMVQLKDVINTMVDKLGQFAKEVTRVSQEVGTEGYTIPLELYSCTDSLNSKLGGQALVLDVEGTWRELTGVVNKLAANLTSQVRSIALVTKAVALGDLSKQIEVDARGEILDLKNTVNGMVVRYVLVIAYSTLRYLFLSNFERNIDFAPSQLK